MDQVQEEQASMREEIDSVKSKIDHILETVLALAIREYEIRVAAVVRNDTPVQWPTSHSGPSVPVPNPVIYGFPLGFTSPPEGSHVPQPLHTFGVTDGFVA